MNNQRQYGVDILRILSMLGVVALHILTIGEALWQSSDILSKGFLMGVYVITSCCVNVFAMLTGYLYAEKTNMRSANLIRLLLTSFLYNGLLLFVVWQWKPEAISPDLPRVLFPVLSGRYWYITSYVPLFVLIPYLNIMIQNLGRQRFRVLLILLLVLFSVINTAVPQWDPFVVRKGYSPIWLIVCYLVGAHIRLYSGRGSRLKLWGILLAVSVVGLTVAFFFFAPVVIRLMNYNSPFMVLNAALLLLIFSRIRIPSAKMGKLILSLSGAAFGVYIMHSHILIFDLMIAGNMGWIGQGNLVRCVGALAGITVGIYGVCWLAEVLRGLLYRWTGLDRLLKRLGAWCDRLLKWDS